MHSRTPAVLTVQKLVILPARGPCLMSRKPRGFCEPCPAYVSCLCQPGLEPYPTGATTSEPPQPTPTITLSLSVLFTGPSAGSSSARFSRRPTCPDASVAGSLPTPPVPRHRKSHSLGNKWVTEHLPTPPNTCRGLQTGLSVGHGLAHWGAPLSVC